MRHHRLAPAAAATLLSAGALLAVSACSSDEVTTRANPSAATTQSPLPQSQSPSAPMPSPSHNARVGDTITVTGSGEGEKLDATLKRWLPSAQSADEYSTPQTGKKWVAAQLELKNVGTAVYADSPSNGMQVADTQGQRFEATFADIAAGPSMTSDAKVPPGEKVLGWITFEVPTTSDIVTVQFAMNSGFADQTAQWQVP
ncbi:DUF4352 domain-containing protein [Streptomyces sp. NPDC050738]|uniref:DUF4352 domain-containing protein n=1 Tax=Streptomyces sp. NPDC050738 TaxID=3154744 RepID=UPI0034387BCD